MENNLLKVIKRNLCNFMDFEDIKYFNVSKPYNFKNIAKNLLLPDLQSNDNFNLFAAIQTHSNIPILINDLNIKFPLYGDALITNLKNTCIGITTADCLPILFYESRNRVIAAIHAGWRGLYTEIIRNTINSMIDFYQCNTDYIKCLIGPSICQNHYEIGLDLVDLFKNKFNNCENFIIFNKSKYFMDLKEIALKQLCDCGILEKNIQIINICTYESHNYYSARRDGNETGRNFMGLVML